MAQLKNSERSFFFFEIEVVSGKPGAPLPTMTTLVNVWQRYHAAGRARQAIRNGEAHLILGDIAIDVNERVATMLVRLSDSQAPNAVYSNVQTNAFTEHLKGAADGNDMGAHVIISTAPELNNPNVYFAAVEGVPGVPYHEVRRLLNRLIRYQYHDDISVFTYPDPMGKKKRDGTDLTHDHLPRTEFRGRPSATFIADIQRGKISGISVVKTEQTTPVAGVAYLTKKTSELKFGISHGNAPQNIWDDIKRVFRSQAAEYPEGKVAFKLPNQPRGVTVVVDAATGAPISELYIQSVLIKPIVPFLSNSSQVIVPHLVALAKPHLLSRRNV